MAIYRDTPVNRAIIRVIDREMINQSMFPKHQPLFFPTKSTRVVKMAARIEVDAYFSNWEEWNKTLENYKSSHQVESSVFCSKIIAAANRRPSPKVVQHPYMYDDKYAQVQYGCIHSDKPTSRSSGLRPNQP